MPVALIALIVVLLLVVFGFGLLGFALTVFWTLAWYITVGVVIGGLGRLVVPGSQKMSLLETSLFGIAGALVGGIIANDLLDVGWLGQLVCAVIVAAVLLLATGAGRPRESAS